MSKAMCSMTDAELGGRGTRSAAVGKYPPRWIRVPPKGLCPDTGWSRPQFYAAIRSGAIRTALIRRPGTTRGRRYVFLPSVLSILDREADREARRIAAAAKAREVTHESN